MRLTTGSRWLLLGCAATLAALGGAARADVEREAVDPILRLDLPGHTSEVRSLVFLPSGQLMSGGRDKVAMIWDVRGAAAGVNARDIGRKRVRDRVVRWQVARGTRGAIQALAVSPTATPVAAIAGSGAMGSTGEILVVDPADGTLVAVLGGGERTGHRGSVVALDFSPDGNRLFSADVDGQVFSWDRAAEWRPVELAGREETRLGADRAAALRLLPAARPLAAVQGGRVAIPTLVSPAGAATPLWQIEIVSPPAAAGAAPAAARRLLPHDLKGVVLAMDASPDGRFLAASDLAGTVAVWDLAAAEARPTVIDVSPAAESVAVSPDGRRIVVGVATKPGAAARIEIRDVATGRTIAARPMPAAVRAVATSADGATFAAAGGWNHEILVDRLDVEPPAGEAATARGGRRLGGVGRRIGRVAFAKQEGDAPPAKVAIGLQAADGPQRPELSEAFDMMGLAVAPVGNADAWAAAAGRPGTWSMARGAAQREGFETWQLSQGGRPAGSIDLELSWQGRLGPAEACATWLTRDGQAEPWAVVLGTDRGLFVYELRDKGGCPVIRRYRGHEDGVLAVAVSQDGRWLASGGRDGLVMLWPLSGVGAGGPLFERWGVGLKLENGRAVVDSVDEAGTLAGRDVRVGDVIARASWGEGAVPPAAAQPTVQAAADGPAVIAALTHCDWPTQMSLVVERDGKAADPFNRLPAWENIASLHLAANREWAFWSPRGYYAASANGDTLFGWLVNRGVDRLPRFFRANQFRRRLERPDVMSRLLAAGSLGAALRTAARDVPKSSAVVLPELIVATPEVSIVSPRSDAALDAATLRVTAAIEIPAGVEVSRVRAYASGVAGPATPQVVADEPAAEGRPARRTYAWDLPLPDESEHLVQVFVGTAAGPTDVAEITVAAPAAAAPPRRKPRLFLLATGVDHYAHSDRFAGLGLANLAYAAADARAFGESLANRAASRFDVAGNVLLLDAGVTRAAWRENLESLRQRLAADVLPDDLIVVFLAGHGMIDETAGREYCYLCHDAELEERPGGVVPARSASITWQDFAALDGLPCRKLAIVDTCHSGGLGPARRSTAVREFQENMILVLAAASDDEASQESATWGHGAFTTSLLEALSGRADTRSTGRRSGTAAATTSDGFVTLDELADYVSARVPELTAAVGSGSQHPTVSPVALLPFMTLPIAADPAGGPAGR